MLGLSEAQRTERLANLPHLRHRHRTGWALSLLKAAGYAESPARGTWRISERGRQLLARFPDGFDEETGRRIVREGRRRSLVKGAVGDGTADVGETVDEQTPHEVIDGALEELRREVAGELLERIAQAPPAFFEGPVLDLPLALGYGASEDDLAGRAGSGWRDRRRQLPGQARSGEGLHPGEALAGGRGPTRSPGILRLAGRRARKGVFITTSSFTREAREFASQMADSVVLVDGVRLTSLVIEHGVGVTHYRVIRRPRMDEDDFDAD